MKETYFTWQGISSKDMGILCENITISPLEQKLKILSTSNRDNNYNYTTMNIKNRPFFENRIITISTCFKFNDLEEKTSKLSKIINWIYNYNYDGENDIEILPDYSNVKWVDAKLENIQQIEVVSMHMMRVIIQFRVNCFSVDKTETILMSDSLDFTQGSYSMVINNKGFYTNNFKIVLNGACNWTTIKNKDNNYFIDIASGFSKSCEIDFYTKSITIDGVISYPDIDFYELKPLINNFTLESDGSYVVEFHSVNNYIYSYPKDDKNTLSISLGI